MKAVWRRPRRVVYTCMFGYSERFNDFVYEGAENIDFICFTDDPKLISAFWKFKVVPSGLLDPPGQRSNSRCCLTDFCPTTIGAFISTIPSGSKYRRNRYSTNFLPGFRRPMSAFATTSVRASMPKRMKLLGWDSTIRYGSTHKWTTIAGLGIPRTMGWRKAHSSCAAIVIHVCGPSWKTGSSRFSAIPSATSSP